MKKYLLKVKILLVTAFMMSILMAFFNGLIPILEKVLIDSFYDGNLELKQLSKYISIFIFCNMICLISSFFYNIIQSRWQMILENHIQNDLFASISQLKYSAFCKRENGEYISVTTNNIDVVVKEYLSSYVSLLQSIFKIVVYAGIILYSMGLEIAVFIFILSTIVTMMPKFFKKKLGKLGLDAMNAVGLYTARIEDLLKGFFLIDSKTIDCIDYIHKNEVENMTARKIRMGKFAMIAMSVETMGIEFMKLAIFVFIAKRFENNNLSIGSIVAIFSYLLYFVSPLQEAIQNINFIHARTKVKNDLLNLMEDVKIKIPKKSKKTFEKSICLENICISYPDFSLKNFNGVFVKGNKYIVTGHSGCGKSTILRLIVKETELENGKIYVDGEDINEIEVDEIISIVHQNEHIYKASFEENIRMFGSYSKENYSRVLEVISSEISNKIKDTLDCSSLSGGEKQIVSFMRALTSDKEILILDEPFSALDKKNKSHMLEILKNIEDKTIIMVSHDVKDENEKLDIRLLEDIV